MLASHYALFRRAATYQQGWRHARRGLQFTCEPAQKIGQRIANMTLKGKPIEAKKSYKVASWAPVTEGVSGEPVWDAVVKYLRDKKVIRPPRVNRPRLIGVKGNPGIA